MPVVRQILDAYGRMSLRDRFLVSWTVASLLIGLVGLIGLLQLGSVNGITEEITKSWVPRHEALDRLAADTTAHKLLVQQQLEVASFRHLAEVQRDVATLTRSIAQEAEILERQLQSVDERGYMQSFRDSWVVYLIEVERAVGAREIGQITQATAIFDKPVRHAFTEAKQALGRLDAALGDDLAGLRAAAEAKYRFSFGLVLAITMLSIAASALGSAWIKRSVSSPIIRVSQAMHRLTMGGEVAALDVDRTRQDEVGILMHSVNAFRHSRARELELATLADQERSRLDAAIENMPMGLAMFDAGLGLIVCNASFLDMYGLPADLAQSGRTAEKITADLVARQIICAASGESILRLLDHAAESANSMLRLDLSDGRTISLKSQRMRDGGWVTIHEDVTEQHKAEARIRHMARHDVLTDLPNRGLFRDRCESALQDLPADGRLAILCLDLDRFKLVNDTLGHPAGDQLLQCVADRLRSCLGAHDTAARFGGDEFVVLKTRIASGEDAELFAQKVIAELSAPYEIANQHVSIGCSVGIALARDHGIEAEQLLKQADIALYRAKADGRGVARTFGERMDARIAARSGLEVDLREAIERDQMSLHYQPIADLSRMEIAGFEALLRWQHPERGMVAPSEFIRVAEDTGLIERIGDWVLRRACADASQWPAPLKLAVNLSPVQFRRGHVVTSIREALAVSGLAPDRLEIEITEGLMLRQSEAILEMLHELRELGIGILMDDFGTGYSSLSYVRKFPFDAIKIDRSFVRDVLSDTHCRAIVDTALRLATRLDMATIAEGVETGEQLAYLISEGCTHAQGYFIAPPAPAASIPATMFAVAERLRAARETAAAHRARITAA
ncbi:MAG: EAL domain-containing protein [Hyphomicrobiaceae bacterium]